VFVKNKTKSASGVGCSGRVVMYVRELLFKSNKKKFSFRRVENVAHRCGVAITHDIHIHSLYTLDSVSISIGLINDTDVIADLVLPGVERRETPGSSA